MLQRQRSRTVVSKNEIFLIGEQLRYQMHVENKIEDRRYRLRTYKACFVGSDAVDWLIQTRHAHTREEAISSMRILQDYLVIHHVCDDHVFKDEHLLYRFRRDDDSFMFYTDLKSFYQGQRLSGRLHNNKEILRDIQANGQLYRSAFLGYEVVDWLVESHEVYHREDAINYCKRLMENNIIKHVTDDFNFCDDHHFYQFVIDFSQSYLLCDISRFKRNTLHNSCGTTSDITELYINQDDRLCEPYNLDFKDDAIISEQTCNKCIPRPQSVLLRHVTAEELEDADTPYVKHKVQVLCDSVDYGFVIRGEGPVYIQIIDPNGPAAEAGLKVRQFLHSVNGMNVLREDHKTVAKMIFQNPDVINLVVMTHKRDKAS